ncbi:unnamed protein product [Leuciscus chuanchicus]
MLTTGGGHAGPELSEIDQCIVAIIGETPLSGVPSAEQLDTDQGPISTASYPPRPSPTSESDGNPSVKRNLTPFDLPAVGLSLYVPPGPVHLYMPSGPVQLHASSPMRSWITRSGLRKSVCEIASTLATIS